jgi:ADP-ribosylglycohydrolase
LLGLPAGIGFATLRSILKLWLGFGPRRSGVWSAGNGPAMRSAIIGAYFANEPEKMKEYAEASTRMTHTDPKALIGALAVAQVTAWNIQHPNEPGQTLCLLKEMDGDPDWKAVMGKLEKAFREGRSVAEFAGKLGLEKGVSGYVYHSVPVAVFAVLRHPTDFRGALEAVFNCGGDTDTVGAIAGAILGASVCKQGIPQDWIGGIADWPRSCALLEKVSDRLVEQKRSGRALGPVGYFWPALILRNLIFLFTVLAHGFKRLAPPY